LDSVNNGVFSIFGAIYKCFGSFVTYFGNRIIINITTTTDTYVHSFMKYKQKTKIYSYRAHIPPYMTYILILVLNQIFQV